MALLVTQTVGERFVFRRVVDDQDFYLIGVKTTRNAGKHLLDRAFGIVSDDKDQKAFAPKVDLS